MNQSAFTGLCPQSALSGTLVAIAGQGILITGPPAVGKSETALELVRRGHGLVADDLVELEAGSTTVLQGRAAEGCQGFIEVRGVGILNVGSLYGAQAILPHAPIVLEVALSPPDHEGGSELDRIRGIAERRAVNGCWFPLARLWASPGRPIATLVEALAHRLRGEQAGVNEVERFLSMQRQKLVLP